MIDKILTERICIYHKNISEFDRDRILMEIATILFAIFLKLKDLEEALPEK